MNKVNIELILPEGSDFDPTAIYRIMCGIDPGVPMTLDERLNYPGNVFIEFDPDLSSATVTLFGNEPVESVTEREAYARISRLVNTILVDGIREDVTDIVYPTISYAPVFGAITKMEAPGSLSAVDFDYTRTDPETDEQHVVVDMILPTGLTIDQVIDRVVARFPNWFNNKTQDDEISCAKTQLWFTHEPVAHFDIDMRVPYESPVDDVDKTHPAAKPIGFASGIMDTIYDICENHKEESENE